MAWACYMKWNLGIFGWKESLPYSFQVDSQSDLRITICNKSSEWLLKQQVSSTSFLLPPSSKGLASVLHPVHNCIMLFAAKTAEGGCCYCSCQQKWGWQFVGQAYNPQRGFPKPSEIQGKVSFVFPIMLSLHLHFATKRSFPVANLLCQIDCPASTQRLRQSQDMSIGCCSFVALLNTGMLAEKSFHNPYFILLFFSSGSMQASIFLLLQEEELHLLAGNTAAGVYHEWPQSKIIISLKAVPELKRMARSEVGATFLLRKAFIKRTHFQANGHTAGNAHNLSSEQAIITPIEPFLTWLAICYAILSLYRTQRCDGLHRSIKIGKSSSEFKRLNVRVFSLLIIILYQHYFRSKLHEVLQAGLEFGAALPFAEIIQELRQPVDGSPAPEPYLRMALHIDRIAGKWQHLARKEDRWDPSWHLMIQDMLECFGTNGSIAGHNFQSDMLSRLHALKPMKDLSSLDRCNLTACCREDLLLQLMPSIPTTELHLVAWTFFATILRVWFQRLKNLILL